MRISTCQMGKSLLTPLVNKNENFPKRINSRYPSIFAPRKSARQIAEEYHEFSERYERERNLQWQEWNNWRDLELDFSSISPAVLMRELFNHLR